MIKSKYNWMELYREFAQSGLTKTAFIKRKRLPTSAYAKLDEMKYEFQKIAEDTYDENLEAENVAQTNSDVDAPVFIPVQVIRDREPDTPQHLNEKSAVSTNTEISPKATPVVETSPIILEKDGYCIKIYRDFDSVTLLRILEVMNRC